ncbi:hypothetical protein SRB5_24510 [Streptomyces sp. RB5]|uniref:Uncharacterized protein n=2 Tax=Streptomyces smaragdinus TaxID=2585196 RepID=A0A7K0CFT3_9ACTN|nr:hypothetical protein [Streptomyces smaragdinus]
MNGRVLAIVGAVAVIGGLVWNGFAENWTDRGCSRGQAFALVMRHGKPDDFQGCVETSDGPEYTEDYYGG